MDYPKPLSAVIKGSFAYVTVKDRLPVIVTKIIDSLHQEKKLILKTYGMEGVEESKDITGRLSCLKNEIQTDKKLRPIYHPSSPMKYDDSSLWNKALEEFSFKNNNEPLYWFQSPWLFIECYMYKRIHEAFYQSQHLSQYDPFGIIKENSLSESASVIKNICGNIINWINNASTFSVLEMKDTITRMLQISLWGNRCDLSISNCEHKSFDFDVNSLSHFLLSDNSEAFISYLFGLSKNSAKIAFILDNAGVELIADLSFATLFLEFSLVSSVTFYPKTQSWFVSDTTKVDIYRTFEFLRNCNSAHADLIKIWMSYLETKKWLISEDTFWTSPYDFSQMKSLSPKLYEELSQYDIIIFKGDLNYRKLVGDLDWPNDTELKTAFRGFCPSNILILRTLKGGPVVGISAENIELAAQNSNNWDVSGDYGVVQMLLQ